MDEMAPAVALPFRIGNPIEVARLKMVTDTAGLLPDPMATEPQPSAEKGDDREEVRTMPGSDDDELLSVGVGPEQESELSAGSSCSMVSDCSSVASASEEFSALDAVCDSTTSSCSVDLVVGSSLVTAVAGDADIGPAMIPGSRSVFLMDYVPLWGSVSICGRRPEMEDAVVTVPRFFEIPLRMLTADLVMDGINPDLISLPAHFFGVYDGHGGAQVANYCRDRVHLALIEELRRIRLNSGGSGSDDTWQKQWEKAFVNCFVRVDDEVGGKAGRGIVRNTSDASEEATGSTSSSGTLEPVAPETVGSTAVVAVICSSHIIIANCGDSRAVLCRGKQPVPLSVDHKPNREDEYARIEAEGGKVIQWNGYRVCGVLAMSRSIGDRYLKPWIIPYPEVTIVPRTREDECLILASDGLWDVMSNEEVCDAARRRILLWHKKNGITLSSSRRSGGEEADPAAQAAADYLSRLALRKGSKDNITVIVVALKAQRKFKSKA